jgi:septal ring factor EnvC (AmiA/AmiB activator)
MRTDILGLFSEALTATGVKRSYRVVRDSLNALTYPQKQVVWIFALVCSVILAANTQQTDELQKQIQELKQQYEQKTREVQERIAALEQQLQKVNEARQEAPKKEGAVPAAAAAAQKAPKAALGQSLQTRQPLQGQLPSAPTYDFVRDADTSHPARDLLLVHPVLRAQRFNAKQRTIRTV